MKQRAYCKLHNTFSHATNDCNVLRRQIQSAINEGRLVVPAMQIDQNPFPVHTLELSNPKVLIRPHQAESTKGKNVVVGEERHEKKVLQSKTPRASKSSWPSMRRMELFRGTRNGQMKPRVPSQRQHPVSNRILAYIKVIVLLCQILSRSLHGSGRILVIIHLWIIVGCICSPIIFNILLYIQIVFHKDRLTIIWSKKSLIAAKRVRRT